MTSTIDSSRRAIESDAAGPDEVSNVIDWAWARSDRTSDLPSHHGDAGERYRHRAGRTADISPWERGVNCFRCRFKGVSFDHCLALV